MVSCLCVVFVVVGVVFLASATKKKFLLKRHLEKVGSKWTTWNQFFLDTPLKVSLDALLKVSLDTFRRVSRESRFQVDSLKVYFGIYPPSKCSKCLTCFVFCAVVSH